MVSRRSILATAAAMPAWALAGRALAANAAPTGPSVDELLRPGVMIGAAISPSGRRIAVARFVGETAAEGGEGLQPCVLVRDAQALDQPPRRIGVGPATVDGVEWASDDRLLIWLNIARTETQLLPRPVSRVVVVDADGGNETVLFHNLGRLLRRGFSTPRLVDALPDDDDAVLMQIHDEGRKVEALYRVDVRDGTATLVERGARMTEGWHSQNGVPVLRFASDRDQTVWSVEARAPGDRRWKPLRDIRLDELNRKDFSVVGVSREPGVLMVLSHEEGAETNALRAFDSRTMSFGPVLAQRPDRDIQTAFVDETGALIGAAWVGDRVGYDFTDPVLARHYRSLERYFGEECNLVLADISRDRDRLLLQATGPRQPGAWFFYDLATARLEPLGEDRPWLKRERLGRTEPLRVTTRDGARITAYLTTPTAPGRRPLVVLPHGGPELRDQLAFDPFVQALAAKGWFVLQPNFRGSSGYGRAFADAGRRRWGDRMQEDVEDAVASVVASGRVDPDRIAICGASYGGYAALMGAVRGQVRYRRAVSIAGVSDLPELLAFERDADGKDTETFDYFRRTIGDPQADAAMLVSASPARRAAEIAAPVLLIHGRLDLIAPYEQSKIMAEALRKAGKPVRFETLAHAGHQNWRPEDWRRILELTTGFLAEGFDEIPIPTA